MKGEIYKQLLTDFSTLQVVIQNNQTVKDNYDMTQ